MLSQRILSGSPAPPPPHVPDILPCASIDAHPAHDHEPCLREQRTCGGGCVQIGSQGWCQSTWLRGTAPAACTSARAASCSSTTCATRAFTPRAPLSCSACRATGTAHSSGSTPQISGWARMRRKAVPSTPSRALSAPPTASSPSLQVRTPPPPPQPRHAAVMRPRPLGHRRLPLARARSHAHTCWPLPPGMGMLHQRWP